MNPKVSIIIPAYNPGPLIDEAVASARSQTYTNTEIVLIDDGSHEDLSRFERAPDIKFIRQENKGLPTARNVAIAQSTGELIAYLDADDLWLPTKVEQQVRYLEESGAALTYSAFEIIDENGIKKGNGWAPSARNYEELLLGCSICCSSVMMRRDVLHEAGLFNPLCLAAADFDLWLRVALRHDLHYSEQSLVLYRMHSGSRSLNYLRTARATEEILQRHLRYIQAQSNRTAEVAVRKGLENTRRTFAYQAFDMCRLHVRKRDARKVMSHLWQTIALSRSLEIPVKSVMSHQIFGNGTAG